MKVWASASAIGLSLAYFAGCSSEPPTDNGYVPTGGTSSTAGTNSTSGTGNNSSGSGGSGTSGSSSTAGTETGGSGTAGSGGSGTAGTDAGGTGGTGVAAACPDGVDGHCKEGVDYPTYDGYTLKLVEEFDAPLNLNTDPIWTWSDGSPQDGQTRFREDALKFENGYMTITATQQENCAPATNNPGCVPNYDSYGEAFDPNEKRAILPMGVWSGEIRTKYNNYRYGRYEAKFAAPIANPDSPNAVNSSAMGESGNFLSTMFVFRTPKNVDWNEIDIELEPWGTTSVYGNLINAKGRTGYPSDANDSWKREPGGTYKIYDEHVYAFNWTPTGVEWFVDGVSIRKYTGKKDDGNNAPPIPTLSTKIMMNLWVFQNKDAFGDAGKNKLPFSAKYDWFRFYKFNGDETYPCSPTPGCLPAADKSKSSQNNPKEMNYGK